MSPIFQSPWNFGALNRYGMAWYSMIQYDMASLLGPFVCSGRPYHEDMRNDSRMEWKSWLRIFFLVMRCTVLYNSR